MPTENCPVCSTDAVYDHQLDRWVHVDGSDNGPCWAAITLGTVVPT